VERDADRALARLVALGVRPRLWRTPWGDTASFTQSVADQRDLRLVHWSLDTHDWRGDSSQQMLITTRDGLRPGAVVLAHDGIGPGALRADCRHTIEYVSSAVDHVRGAGGDFVTLA
jgi:peptidoglycan-N-acetylglucosamine deacetylase